MDPSIMKLLEEDEDETMHSGADVEALTAALNRDIEGDTSTSQPSDSENVLSQGSNHTSSQLFSQWQTSSQDENTDSQSQQELKSLQQQELNSSDLEQKQHGSGVENQQQVDASHDINRLPLQQKQSQDDPQQLQSEPNPIQFSQAPGIQISEKNSVQIPEPDRIHNPDKQHQFPELQKINNQQGIATEQASNSGNQNKHIPFGMLLPSIIPHLDKDRALQLRTLYAKLKKNEIPKLAFVRLMRGIVGDQMLKLAVMKLQQSPTGPSQFQLQSQASALQQHLKTPSSIGSQFSDPHSFSQLHQKGQSTPADSSHMPSSAMKVQTDSSYPTTETNSQKPREMERQSDSHGMQGSQMSSSSLSSAKQEREHSTPFTMYGSAGGNYHSYTGTNVNTSATSTKQQPHDSQMRQVPLHQNIGSTQMGGTSQAMNPMSVPKFERQSSVNDPKRVQGGSLPHPSNSSTLQQSSQQQKSQLSTPQNESLEKQASRIGFSSSMSMLPPNSVSSSMGTHLDPNVTLGSRIPSVTSPVGINTRTPPKKPSIGQKKPLEALGSSPPLPSKKQKVSGAFLDQSIEQLNDVTAVSGVNLREEEEQLFSGPKEDSRVSEASRRVVQEEEERLILQKAPLQKKLAEIMARCSLKNISNDVERCLSLCVEERLRGFISNLIRLSKQRADVEKPRHRSIITSDIRQQILIMNHKAREEWEKKQAEAEKLRKLNEPEGSTGVDGDKDKDEGRVKSLKANKEEDDKMRTTAANVAARAAVGGDDMLSKWQLMAEQARQKREGGIDAASGSQPGKDASRKLSSTSGRNARENQEAEKRGYSTVVSSPGGVRKFGRNNAIVPQTRVARNITVKDVISVLEREPQMLKSTLIYRLYEKMRSGAATE
ncbi:unnamed protein product, partial [Vitis vinifera]